MAKRTGYFFLDPLERLARYSLQGTSSGAVVITTGDIILPSNTRRIQILAPATATFRVGDTVTVNTCGAIPVLAGQWYEIPPLCDRVNVNTLTPLTVYVIALAGPDD